MSLISEALKRARADGARREAAERGLRYPPRYPTLPAPAAPSRRPRWLLTAALVVLALGAGLAAGYVLLAPASRSPVPAAAAPPAAKLPEPTAAPVEPTAVARPAAPERVPEPVKAPPAAPPAAAPTALPAPAPVSRPAAANAAEASEYLRQVALDGDEKIVLAGIAWSPEHPVALLNGQPLGVGEIVHGYTVVRIRPDGVELRGRGRMLFLRLK